jgi:N-acetylmuramoyl-L-alanine amidase
MYLLGCDKGVFVHLTWNALWLLGVEGFVNGLLTVLLSATAWPSPDVSLSVAPVPRLASPIRIAIDAGHGVQGNTGNWGCHCQKEADETLVEAMELARRLRRFGFTVFETRTTQEGPTYRARIAAIEHFKPQLVISLHTDARGEAWPLEVNPDRGMCFANRADPGFSVLWSEEGTRSTVRARETWGRALSEALRTARFLPYSGNDYLSLYTPDAEPACFVDARPKKQRVFFLRATKVAPVVIVETHHALDPLEVARWREADTHDAFAAAVASAALKVVEQR